MISIAGVDSPYLLAQPQGYILLPVVTLRINNNNVNNTFQPWYLGYPRAMREESYKLHYHIQAHVLTCCLLSFVPLHRQLQYLFSILYLDQLYSLAVTSHFQKDFIIPTMILLLYTCNWIAAYKTSVVNFIQFLLCLPLASHSGQCLLYIL